MSEKFQFFDGRKFTRDEKTGYYLCSTKDLIGSRKRMHVYVWEYYNGLVPEGYHIHHIDAKATYHNGKDQADEGNSMIVGKSLNPGHQEIDARFLCKLHSCLFFSEVTFLILRIILAWHFLTYDHFLQTHIYNNVQY